MTEKQTTVLKTTADTLPKMGSLDTLVTDELAASWLPKRSFGAHKWGVGGVVILAGAPQFVGAATLCALSASRAGAGVVNLAVSRGLVPMISPVVPEATYVLIPETETASGAKHAVEMIREKAEKSKALVIGPGLGEDEAADGLLSALFDVAPASPIGFSPSLGFSVPNAKSGDTSRSTDTTEKSLPDLPVVLDADGLNWLAKHDDWPSLLPKGRFVLTPHVGEMGRLLKRETEELLKDPVATAKEAAVMSGQVVCFKYGHTVVTNGKQAYVASDAPMSLATAGSGDVLAGSIGAFIAQGVGLMEAAALAVHLGGKAARRLEQRFGTLGVVASDIPVAVAEVMGELERG